MLKIIKILVTTIAIICITPKVFAFKVSPFKLNLSSKGNTSRGNFVVDNNTEATKAINVYILKRDMDENAKEINEEVDGEFSVYPAQMILRPGEKQDVRIQYLGNPNIQYENAYRLVAEELPLNFVQHEAPDEYKDKANGGVGIVLTYNAALYVAPPNSKPSPKVKLHNYQYNKEQNVIDANIENTGDKHIVLKSSMFDLHVDGTKHEWCEESAQYIGSINMLANKRVNLKIPLCDEKFKNITLEFIP